MTVEELQPSFDALRRATDFDGAWLAVSSAPQTIFDGVVTSKADAAFVRAAVELFAKTASQELSSSVSRALRWSARACLNELPDESNEGRIDLHQTRERLAKWLTEMPWPQRGNASREVLAFLREELDGPLLRPACWLIAQLGWRDDHITSHLLGIASTRDDEDGDLALSAAVQLGSLGERQPEIEREALRRFRRRFNNATRIAMGFLRPPLALDAIGEVCLAEQWQWTRGMSAFSVAGIIARVAQAHPHTAMRAVELLRQLHRCAPEEFTSPVLFGGEVLPLIPTTEVIGFLLDLLLLHHGTNAKERHAAYLALHRLEDCLHPSQLNGFDATKRRDEIRVVIRSELLMPATYNGRQMTMAAEVKERFCRLAFSLGETHALGWLGEILKAEASPYTRHTLMEDFACFRVSPLPEPLVQWITEQRDVTGDDPGAVSLLNSSATQIIRSAGSLDALELLLRPGFTLSGATLWETVAAPAELAVWLACNGEASAVTALVSNIFFERPSGPALSAVCRTLYALAWAQTLPEHVFHEVAQTLSKDWPDDEHPRSLLIGALGAGPGEALSIELRSKLEAWAGTTTPWLSWRALHVLCVHSMLPSHPELLGKLGLSSEGYDWRWEKREDTGGWIGALVGELFQRHGTAFERALVDLLESAEFADMTRALETFSDSPHSVRTSFPDSCARALLRRVRTHHTRYEAEPALFFHLSHLAPTALAEESWAKDANIWLPESREALANALGNVPGNSAANATHTLLVLLEDVHPGVRRAAARALGRSMPTLLFEIVKDRACAEAPSARVRGAELIHWVPEENRSPRWQQLLDQIREDAAYEVRESVESATQMHQRRAWAAEYLQHVKIPNGHDNQHVFTAWKYAAALVQVGDDDTVLALREFLHGGSLAPHFRYFIERTLKAVEKKWNEVRRKWPEPLAPVLGAMETGDCKIQGEGYAVTGECVLLRNPRSATMGLRWHGYVTLSAPTTLELDSAMLIFSGRPATRISIHSIHNSLAIAFTGIGVYPASHAPQS